MYVHLINHLDLTLKGPGVHEISASCISTSLNIYPLECIEMPKKCIYNGTKSGIKNNFFAAKCVFLPCFLASLIYPPPSPKKNLSLPVSRFNKRNHPGGLKILLLINFTFSWHGWEILFVLLRFEGFDKFNLEFWVSNCGRVAV